MNSCCTGQLSIRQRPLRKAAEMHLVNKSVSEQITSLGEQITSLRYKQSLRSVNKSPFAAEMVAWFVCVWLSKSKLQTGTRGGRVSPSLVFRTMYFVGQVGHHSRKNMRQNPFTAHSPLIHHSFTAHSPLRNTAFTAYLEWKKKGWRPRSDFSIRKCGECSISQW